MSRKFRTFAELFEDEHRQLSEADALRQGSPVKTTPSHEPADCVATEGTTGEPWLKTAPVGPRWPRTQRRQKIRLVQLAIRPKWPRGTKKVCIQFPHREALIAEPVLQLPNAQRGVHESFCSGKTIVGPNREVTDFLHRRLPPWRGASLFVVLSAFR